MTVVNRLRVRLILEVTVLMRLLLTYSVTDRHVIHTAIWMENKMSKCNVDPVDDDKEERVRILLQTCILSHVLYKPSATQTHILFTCVNW